MAGLEKILLQHPSFQGLDASLGNVIARCVRNVRFEGGTYLFREDEEAKEFYLLREGTVALEVTAPARPPAVFLTLGRGELLGVSWLTPPYRWSFDARAVDSVRALGVCTPRACRCSTSTRGRHRERAVR
jgi:CRP/FNR family transcriptional regulator, cyclic AMP receptor protein